MNINIIKSSLGLLLSQRNIKLITNMEPPSTIVSFDSLEPYAQDLLQKAVAARTFAYCPYSNFQVGACLLSEDGITYTGCNVENLSSGVTICAERTAFTKAVSEGKQKFKAIAVVAFQENSFTSPCGACRQFMSEFGNIEVYCGKPDLKDIMVTSVEKLLPLAFSGQLG